MENIEVLKQELLAQKDAIETKGGSVSVSNLNPSPSEITAGIKTISVPDLSSATANIEDVAFGKTFYSGDNSLKVGIQEVADLTLATAGVEDVAQGKTFYAGDKAIKVGTKIIPDLTIADALEENVENGKTFYAGNNEIKTGSLIVPEVEIATATVEDVAFGKTFYAGDKTIKTGTQEVVDFTLATATEQDVVSGKTFYSGNKELKTGTKEETSSGDGGNDGLYLKLFVNNQGWEDETVYYTFPEGVKELSPYLFYNTNKKIQITFNSDLEVISDYDFYKCTNITFTNFSNLTKLHTIGTYGFGMLSQYPIDFENLPQTLTNLGGRCFSQTARPNTSIVLPKSISSAGSYLFSCGSKQEMQNLVMPDDIALTTLPGYMFENMIFDCDFRIPSTVTSLAAGFGYGCSFNNITIPASCTTFANAAFYCLRTEAASYRRLKTVTFESEVPPTMGANPFAEQDKSNGFKIYVPDNAVDVYKANARLSSFVNYIYPVSQKE